MKEELDSFDEKEKKSKVSVAVSEWFHQITGEPITRLPKLALNFVFFACEEDPTETGGSVR